MPRIDAVGITALFKQRSVAGALWINDKGKRINVQPDGVAEEVEVLPQEIEFRPETDPPRTVNAP